LPDNKMSLTKRWNFGLMQPFVIIRSLDAQIINIHNI